MIANRVRHALAGAFGAERLGGLLAEIGTGGLSARLHPDPARDEAVRATLPHVPEHGWSVRAVRHGAGPHADLMFPGGPPEMVEAHSDLLDRMLVDAAGALGDTRLSRRVRALVLLRLQHVSPHREAVRRGLALLALPGNRVAAARILARTVDTIWIAAGDTSGDWSRHSRRAILAGVYVATLLFWLRQGDMRDTEAFLDRRLSEVARLGRLRARLGGRAQGDPRTV